MNGEETRLIDVRHQGLDRVIGAWLVGDVIVDPGPSPGIEELLAGLGDVVPRALALTHIHLDHAGASGVLVERWPDIEIWVHERGARHLIDPGRLLESAGRLYGADMQRLWGRVAAVPERNIRVLGDEETIGAFTVAHTPGHASHHVCYLHRPTATAFVGDLAGVRIPPSELVQAPTPPPDIDIEAWHRSIDVVRGWAPDRLALTHFGAVENPVEHLAAIDADLDRWAAAARERPRAQFIEAMNARLAQVTDSEAAARYDLATPPDQNWQGLDRYWAKRSSVAADVPSGGDGRG